MADSQIHSVEASPFTASEYIAAANTLMGVANELVKQGELDSAAKALESVNLMLEKANEAVKQWSL